MRRQVLHLVRPGATPALVAGGDWLVYLQGMELAARDAAPAPLPAGPISHEQLVDLCFAADLVITW